MFQCDESIKYHVTFSGFILTFSQFSGAMNKGKEDFQFTFQTHHSPLAFCKKYMFAVKERLINFFVCVFFSKLCAQTIQA